MNDKKDDSEGKYDPHDDTASLLESLFKDTKDSQIKLVRRRTRPKSGVKKKVVSKQRKGEGKENSQTPVQKRGRPSPSEKSTEATKNKILSPKTSLPGSKITPKSPSHSATPGIASPVMLFLEWEKEMLLSSLSLSINWCSSSNSIP